MNKFIGQIKKGAEKATAEAGKLRQQMTIKSSIDALRAKANERTRELGELALTQHRRGGALEPEELSICQDIDKIEAEIAQKNEELKALKEEPAASATTPGAAPGGRFCPHCGSPVPPEAGFCSSCGNKL